jgi:hypothetical protein
VREAVIMVSRRMKMEQKARLLVIVLVFLMLMICVTTDSGGTCRKATCDLEGNE